MDPEIERLRAEGGRLSGLAASTARRAEYADGPAYYREKAKADRLRAAAAAAFAQAASLEQVRAKDLKSLHALKRELALDDATWQALVGRVSGGRTTSSGDATAAERGAILVALLKGRGKRPAPRPPAALASRPRPDWLAEGPTCVSDRQWAYIADLVARLGMDEAAFASFVAHTTGLQHWRWLDARRATALITGLKRTLEIPEGAARVPARGAPSRPRP